MDNKLALVQAVAWCQTGDKPFFEPVLIKLHGTKVWTQTTVRIEDCCSMERKDLNHA